MTDQDKGGTKVMQETVVFLETSERPNVCLVVKGMPAGGRGNKADTRPLIRHECVALVWPSTSSGLRQRAERGSEAERQRGAGRRAAGRDWYLRLVLLGKALTIGSVGEGWMAS
jgi:hypothetical protein